MFVLSFFPFGGCGIRDVQPFLLRILPFEPFTLNKTLKLDLTYITPVFVKRVGRAHEIFHLPGHF